MAWWHRKGQKVVCVDVGNWNRGLQMPLVVGHIYTIAHVIEGEVSSNYKGPYTALELAEVQNPFWFVRGHGGFCSERFRPVQTKSSETGVAALKRHLIGAPVKEPAE